MTGKLNRTVPSRPVPCSIIIIIIVITVRGRSRRSVGVMTTTSERPDGTPPTGMHSHSCIIRSHVKIVSADTCTTIIAVGVRYNRRVATPDVYLGPSAIEVVHRTDRRRGGRTSTSGSVKFRRRRRPRRVYLHFLRPAGRRRAETPRFQIRYSPVRGILPGEEEIVHARF